MSYFPSSNLKVLWIILNHSQLTFLIVVNIAFLRPFVEFMIAMFSLTPV
jgi:hypothetical protein